MAGNLRGYDISPDMVRLSLVNLYLHGFTAPLIEEYDTLTSQDKWSETADVILANPPFMSPKGGIKPHNRFSVQSKRSEVLFVDYMAEHLTPTGRAGIIVPEGIIFQSQNSYVQLRKMLVENYLVAVVSLPAGIFQPYSGVKTSILILDKSLAKQADPVGFFKVESDGFGLGAQRRAIEKNDLPQVAAEIADYLSKLRSRESLEGFSPTTGLIVSKEKIAANGDYNLSGERYRDIGVATNNYEIVALGDVCTLTSGGTPSKANESYWTGTIPWVSAKDLKCDVIRDAPMHVSDEAVRETATSIAPVGSLLVLVRGMGLANGVPIVQVAAPVAFNQDLRAIFPSPNVLPTYLRLILRSDRGQLAQVMNTAAHGTLKIDTSDLLGIRFPLPPLSVQKEIVAVIEGYQKVIDGARAVLDHYRPHIPIQPDWPMVELASVCTLISGRHVDKANYNTEGRGLSYLTGPSDFGPISPVITKWTESPEAIAEKGDILVTVKGSGLGSINLLDIEKAAISRQLMAVRVNGADPSFIHTVLASKFDYFQGLANGAAIPGISREHVLELLIPLPPLPEQQKIVAEIEAEQRLVAGNRELIERFVKKIASVLARVWGEAPEVETLQAKLAECEVAYVPGLVAAFIAERLKGDTNLGRTKLEKCNHFLEYHVGIPLNRRAIPYKYGPVDYEQLKKAEAWARERNAFITNDPGDGERVTYIPG
ncbi:MAG: N-6 DNA methylase, partial [Opitutaceae bacterium]